MNSVVTTTRWQTSSAKLARGSGCTSIIGLAAIQAETGSRWERMREAIISRLEQMLRQRLSPSDFFVPIDETSYLVVMPTAMPEEGQIVCLRTAYELHTSLLGACSIDDLVVAPANAVADDVLEMRPLARSELVELAKRADLELAPPKPGSEKLVFRKDTALPSAETSLKYLPVWDAQFQVIRAYRCLTESPKEFDGIPSISHTRELARGAAVVLQRAASVLETHLSQGERFILNMPVSYEILSSPIARMEFVSLCRQLPGGLRPYLGYTIEDLPVGVPQSRLVDLISSLVGFSNVITATVACRQPTPLTAYRGLGLKALGINLHTVMPHEYPNEIAYLVAETKRLGLLAFVDGVSNASVLRTVLDAGIQWMTGPAIAAAIDEPGPLKQLPTSRLLQNYVYV